MKIQQQAQGRDELLKQVQQYREDFIQVTDTKKQQKELSKKIKNELVRSLSKEDKILLKTMVPAEKSFLDFLIDCWLNVRVVYGLRPLQEPFIKSMELTAKNVSFLKKKQLILPFIGIVVRIIHVDQGRIEIQYEMC